jgi:phosphate-selective porin OprO/OprP
MRIRNTQIPVLILIALLLNYALQAKATPEEFKVKGRIHYDWNQVNESSKLKQQLGKQNNTDKFRRARIDFDIKPHEHTGLKLQLDFADKKIEFADFCLIYQKNDQPSITIGHFKEPFSLEELGSTNGTTFIEQGLCEAFVPARNNGLMLAKYIEQNNFGWQAGIFKETDEYAKSESGNEINTTGRVFWTPINNKISGDKLLHLGFSYNHKNLSNNTIRFRQRPETSLTNRFVDTGKIKARHADTGGLEAAWQSGPVSIQSEYIKTAVNGCQGQADVDFTGYYAYISYWLTGENNKYKPESGTFTFVKPSKKLGQNSGWGAWQVALRLSQIDLNHKNINGGNLDSATLALNWHVNDNMRLMLNFIKADSQKLGTSNIILMRTQFHF